MCSWSAISTSECVNWRLSRHIKIWVRMHRFQSKNKICCLKHRRRFNKDWKLAQGSWERTIISLLSWIGKLKLSAKWSMRLKLITMMEQQVKDKNSKRLRQKDLKQRTNQSCSSIKNFWNFRLFQKTRWSKYSNLRKYWLLSKIPKRYLNFRIKLLSIHNRQYMSKLSQSNQLHKLIKAPRRNP